MTKLTKALTRTVVDLAGKPLIVTLTFDGITFRRPRHRKSYLLPYGHAELRAITLEVNHQLAQKKGRPHRTRAKQVKKAKTVQKVSRGLLTIGRR
jgi:hypothetical protein